MKCRKGCAACCIDLSISSFIPGMKCGKPAGIRCIQLSKDNLCLLFNNPNRPEVCRNLKPLKEMCKNSSKEAGEYLGNLERLTLSN